MQREDLVELSAVAASDAEERPAKSARTESGLSAGQGKSISDKGTSDQNSTETSTVRSSSSRVNSSLSADASSVAARASEQAAARASALAASAAMREDDAPYEDVEDDDGDEEDDDEEFMPAKPVRKKAATRGRKQGATKAPHRRRSRRSAAEAMPTLSRLQWWTGRFVKQVLPIRGDSSAAFIGDPGPSVVMVRGAPGVYVHRNDVPQRRVMRAAATPSSASSDAGASSSSSSSSTAASTTPAREPDIVVLHTSTGVAVPASPVIGHGKPPRGFMAGIIIDADVAFRRSYDEHRPQLVEVESVFQLFPSKSVLIVQGRVSSAQTAAQVADYALLELIRTGVCPFKSADEIPFSTRAAEAVGRAMFYELYEQARGLAAAAAGLTDEELKAVHEELVRKWKAQMTEDRSRSVMVDNSPAGTAMRAALAEQAKTATGGIQQTDLTYSAVAMADGAIPLCGQGAQLLPLIAQANTKAQEAAKTAEKAEAPSSAGAASDGGAASGEGPRAGSSQAAESSTEQPAMDGEAAAGQSGGGGSSGKSPTCEAAGDASAGGSDGEATTVLMPATVVATGFDTQDYAQVAADAAHLALIRSGAVPAAAAAAMLTDDAHVIAQQYGKQWPEGRATSQAGQAAAAANEVFLQGGSAGKPAAGGSADSDSTGGKETAGASGAGASSSNTAAEVAASDAVQAATAVMAASRQEQAAVSKHQQLRDDAAAAAAAAIAAATAASSAANAPMQT